MKTLSGPRRYCFTPASPVPNRIYRFIDYHHTAVICRDMIKDHANTPVCRGRVPGEGGAIRVIVVNDFKSPELTF